MTQYEQLKKLITQCSSLTEDYWKKNVEIETHLCNFQMQAVSMALEELRVINFNLSDLLKKFEREFEKVTGNKYSLEGLNALKKTSTEAQTVISNWLSYSELANEQLKTNNKLNEDIHNSIKKTLDVTAPESAKQNPFRRRRKK
ncbi:TPA: hypothetical protein I7730_14230 [Vibrio vulnificus]|uniref:Uncharacterized protein n=1 Tax=Vibrio vulnificus TaxID=672 RepID=A0A8H9N182_VIBVL|nr:hypothetical protein [Vibrio vulnificus]HAS8540944.1 hypothetical protein [Vibrio vulnificus]